MERCVCGNELAEKPFEVVVSPCRCTAPGSSNAAIRLQHYFTQGVRREQYEQRKKIGLPLRCDVERAGDEVWR